jgi:UDP-glucose 4-epimerase
MKLLITGGAGYIGSHTTHLLAGRGHSIVVLDNLVYGHREAIVDSGVELVEGDIGDRDLLNSLFFSHSFDAVIHFAAFAYLGESVQQPLKYYRNNLAAPLSLLEAMRDHGCRKIVFSSTCATYGEPATVPITEAERQVP